MKLKTPSVSRWQLLTTVVTLSLLVGACATVKTGSHRDDNASFSQYRSFSWISDDPLIVGAGGGPAISALTKKKIVVAVEDELRRKGFVQAANRNNADFVLSYTVGTRERIEASSYPSPYQGAWGWHLYGRYYYDTEVVHRMYTEGTLGIDVFDGKSKQPVWHGWATKTISSSDRRDPTAAINESVRAIFSDFPPPPGAK